MKIAPFPELTAYAETLSAEWVDACGATGPMIARPSPTVRAALVARGVPVHLALLTDLSRPASRDAVCRLVAAKVGLECGAAAPALACGSGGWVLVVGSHQWIGFVEPGDPSTRVGGVPVADISEITDPAEALAAIVAALWGAP